MVTTPSFQMNWDAVRVSLLTPFGYDWRGSHFLIDIAKIRLIFELQNIFRKNFVYLTTINKFGGVTDTLLVSQMKNDA